MPHLAMAPTGQIFVVSMVCVALLLNLLFLLAAMWFSNRLIAMIGRNTLVVINNVMILLSAIAVSLIRQGIL